MSDTPNGGPAFPWYALDLGNRTVSSEGLSIRDYFAAAALPEAIRFLRESYEKGGESFEWSCCDDGPPDISEEMAALKAYSMADAMLKARST